MKNLKLLCELIVVGRFHVKQIIRFDELGYDDPEPDGYREVKRIDKESVLVDTEVWGRDFVLTAVDKGVARSSFYEITFEKLT